MCDLGLALGIASGLAGVAAEKSAEKKNHAMINSQARLQHAANERQFIVENNAANKDAYQASLEADRGKALVSAAGAGASGATMAARGAEQGRQGALSIANAKDRASASQANYALSGKEIQIGAQNQINTTKVNPLTSMVNVATAGISNYGAFK